MQKKTEKQKLVFLMRTVKINIQTQIAQQTKGRRGDRLAINHLSKAI
jgi:hypothetical protein